jgi:predicted O-methyltransferase YrrM
MAITTKIKNGLNEVLGALNLRVDSRTEERREYRHLRQLRQNGHFEKPVFTVPEGFRDADLSPVLADLERFRKDLTQFEHSQTNSVGYTFDNDFFTSPDAEVLYTMVRRHEPGRVVEVGSGNSTKVTRQAIRDGGLDSQIVSIDPAPRTEIEDDVDRVRRQRVEEGWDVSPFRELQGGDILFIDSSHNVRTGNDVVFLYLQVLPSLDPGVIVHVHDVFLPFEYPWEWAGAERYGWNEQYLVHALLQNNQAFDVLWPGRFVQHRMDEFGKHFPYMQGGARASSLWLQKSR